MKKILMIFAGLTMGLSLFAQQPTDNPYQSFYGSEQHWTSTAIQWDNITDVTTTNAVTSGTTSDPRFPDATGSVYLVDEANLHTEMDNISNAGGGVLYFPEGKYVFDFDVVIPTGVALRGATPPVDKQDAKKNNFSPPTIFIFPKYLYEESGTGTDNTTAFKHIHSASSFHNGGLVWLTINRALINILPHQADWSKTITEEHEAPYVGTYKESQPTTLRTHVIIFGVRNTNAVEADAAVPTGSQHDYQRWPNRRIGNINAFIYKNGVVSNNRINDVEGCAEFGDGDPYNGDSQQPHFFGSDDGEPATYTNTTYPIESDDFAMNVYLTKDGTQTDNPVLFLYSNKYGVNINRGKLYYKPASYMTDWLGTGWHYTPETEPASFGTNMEINDNWIFKTMRPAMQVGGLGVEIKRNILRDDKNKEDQEIHPAGSKFGAGATTYENRGMDVSGWDCYVDGNWFEAYRSRVGGYLSTCGEGILHQESSGSSIQGMHITNNIGHNYIGLYKSRDIYNVNISGNRLVSGGGGLDPNIMIMSDANACGGDCSRPYAAYNVKADSNEVRSIIMRISAGGNNVSVRGNVANSLTLSCFIEQEGNSTPEGAPFLDEEVGFGDVTPTWYRLEEDDYTDHLEVDAPCIDPQSYPVVEFDNPGVYSLGNEDLGTTKTISFTTTQDGVTDFTGWFYKLYINYTLIEGEMNANGTMSYDWTVDELNTYNITVEVTDTASKQMIYNSEILRYALVSNVYDVVANEADYADLQVYPNPASVMINFSIADDFTGGTARILNNTGAVVRESAIVNTEESLDISSLQHGVYFLSVSKGEKQVVKAFIKK